MAKDKLRALSSRVPDPDEVDRILVSLQKQDDRAAAIVGASLVESKLQELIEAAVHSDEPRLFERLFENRGPLSDFNSKILICQAFGFISSRMASDIQRIRKVRNCFAHARVHVDFETEAVAHEVAELAIVMAVRATKHLYDEGVTFPYNNNKTSFGLSCYITTTILAHQLKSGKLADGKSFKEAATAVSDLSDE